MQVIFFLKTKVAGLPAEIMKDIIGVLRKKGYRFEIGQSYAPGTQLKEVWILSPDGAYQKYPVPFIHNYFYFLLGDIDDISKDDFPQLKKNRKLLKITGKEVYRQVYGYMSDMEFEYRSVPFSKSVKDTIDKVKNSFHLLSEETGYSHKSIRSKIHEFTLGTYFIRAGRIKNGNWYAEYDYEVLPGISMTRNLCFSERPDDNDYLKVINFLENIEHLQKHRILESDFLDLYSS